MKNGHGRHIFISVLLCILVIALFSTCRSRKNVVRTESNQARTERVETKTDTSRVITKIVADMEESVSIHETTDRETIHLDSIGRVRTIVRESVKKETGQRRTDRGQGSVVSITGKSDSITSQETLNATSQEKQDIKTDSRPVQGAEWMWVILSIGTIAAIAILFFIRKVK